MIKIIDHTVATKGIHEVRKHKNYEGDSYYSVNSFESPYQFESTVVLTFEDGRYSIHVDGGFVSRHLFFAAALASFERAKILAKAKVDVAKKEHDRAFLRINNVPEYEWHRLGL